MTCVVSDSLTSLLIQLRKLCLHRNFPDVLRSLDIYPFQPQNRLLFFPLSQSLTSRNSLLVDTSSLLKAS